MEEAITVAGFLVALGGLLFGIYKWKNVERPLAESQLEELDGEDETQQRAEISVEYRRGTERQYDQLELTNVGEADAKDVTVDFDTREGQDFPILDDQLLPVPILEPGANVVLRILTTSTGWMPPGRVEVGWMDPDLRRQATWRYVSR